MNVKEIELSKIKVIENSRIKIEKLEGLMQDIKQHGLKQPIGVAETRSGEYVLVFGHRRLSACNKLGWKRISANVYPDMELAELLVNNVAENIHREETSPVELGRICDRLKKMDLTEPEISAKLSVPLGRIKSALATYNGLSNKYRNRVAYTGKGNGRNGNIPASVAMKVIAAKRNYGLSEAATDKLLHVAKAEEFGIAELSLISMFLDQGFTVTQSIESAKEHKYLRTDIVVNNYNIEDLLSKYKIDSTQSLLQAIMYGELPPLKRPNFFKAKQVPVKE